MSDKFNWTRRGYTEQQFRDAWVASSNLKQVCEILGVPAYGGYYNVMRHTAERLGLDETHMSRHPRNGARSHGKTRPLSEILVYGDRITTSSIRVRLIGEGILEHQCVGCKATTWVDPFTGETKPIPLELDHVDGNLLNNVLENLRLLCPNCHSFTPTYKGRNRMQRK